MSYNCVPNFWLDVGKPLVIGLAMLVLVIVGLLIIRKEKKKEEEEK